MAKNSEKDRGVVAAEASPAENSAPVVDSAPTGDTTPATDATAGSDDTALTADSAPVVDSAPPAPDKTPEPPTSNPPEQKTGKLLVENKKRAGMTVFAVTGKPVVFNADGVAEVDSADYAYLKTVPGYDAK